MRDGTAARRPHLARSQGFHGNRGSVEGQEFHFVGLTITVNVNTTQTSPASNRAEGSDSVRTTDACSAIMVRPVADMR